MNAGLAAVAEPVTLVEGGMPSVDERESQLPPVLVVAVAVNGRVCPPRFNTSRCEIAPLPPWMVLKLRLPVSAPRDAGLGGRMVKVTATDTLASAALGTLTVMVPEYEPASIEPGSAVTVR